MVSNDNSQYFDKWAKEYKNLPKNIVDLLIGLVIRNINVPLFSSPEINVEADSPQKRISSIPALQKNEWNAKWLTIVATWKLIFRSDNGTIKFSDVAEVKINGKITERRT